MYSGLNKAYHEYRVPAARKPTNLRLLKDFLMPKATKFKTSFSTQKSEKGILNELKMILSALDGRQDHNFTKIYNLYN